MIMTMSNDIVNRNLKKIQGNLAYLSSYDKRP